MNRSPTRHAAVLFSLAVAAALAGCGPPQGPFGPPPTVRTVETTASAESRQAGPLGVCLRLAVIDLPLGAASEGEEVWARLREDTIDPERSRIMKANGLRAGVAKARNLVDLIGALEGLTGREILYGTIPAVSDNPRTVTLRMDEPPRTFFMITREGSIRGADYPGGEYMLAVACRLYKDDPSRVLLTAMPQIRSATPDTRIVRTGGRLTFQPYRQVLGLDEAAVTLTMAVGDILVIGPSREARRPSSIGHAFLVGDREGIPFENVLLVIPEMLIPSK
jgi:hypothetical protein